MPTQSTTRFLLVIGILAGALVPLAWVWQSATWTRQWLASRLQAELESVPDEQVPAVVEQLVALGDSGWPTLVANLGHRRTIVRSASQQALHAQFDAWRELPADTSAARVLRLAQLLAERASTDPDELRRAASLAMRALEWPRSGARIHETALTYACEQVIRAARVARVFSEPTIPTAVGGVQYLAWDASRRTPVAVPAPEAPTPVDAAKSVMPSRSSSLPTESHNEASPPAPIISTTIHPGLPRSESLRLAEVPPVPPAFTEPRDGPHGLSLSDRVTGDSAPAAAAVGQWSGLTDVEVVRSLADAARSAAAEKELRRRGFRDRELRIAAATVDPDPQVREQLARILPQLTGIDARPWLLMLARDESASVRAAAIRWLATNDDPRIQEQLREMSNRETDETVRQTLRVESRELRVER